MLSLIKAEYKGEYKLFVKFSDNKTAIVDLQDFIINNSFPIFKPLKNINKFKNFSVDYTIKWDNELDLAPEYLYFQAFRNEENLQSKFREWGYLT